MLVNPLIKEKLSQIQGFFSALTAEKTPLRGYARWPRAPGTEVVAGPLGCLQDIPGAQGPPPPFINLAHHDSLLAKKSF